MGEKKNVLVLEGNDQMKAMLRDYLGRYGFEVISAGNAASALEILAGVKIDVFIIDFFLPGTNGAEFIADARSGFDSAFVIGISSFNKRRNFLDAGADEFLQKPFPLRNLLDIVRAGLCPNGASKGGFNANSGKDC